MHLCRQSKNFFFYGDHNKLWEILKEMGIPDHQTTWPIWLDHQPYRFLEKPICKSVAKLYLALQPHGLQHAKLPCPSLSPRVCSNSCPLIGDAIQSSHPLSPSSPPALNLSQHQGLLQWISSLHQVAKELELLLQHQSFQWIFRTDFPQDGLVWSPRCPRESQESSPTPQFKSINSLALSLLYDLYTTTGKTVARQKREMNLKLVSQNPWQTYKIGNNFRTIYATTRGEGNGNPLQYSCLESPMDRGA